MYPAEGAPLYMHHTVPHEQSVQHTQVGGVTTDRTPSSPTDEQKSALDS